MLKKILGRFALPLFLVAGIVWENSDAQFPQKSRAGTAGAPEGYAPGPDLVVGNMAGLVEYGDTGTQAGLGIGATVCNAGNVEVTFLALPNTDHPVISHNLFRMSGGSGGDERFEQLGQSWVKHAYGAEQFDLCGFGCIPAADNTHLGVGCSDTYLSNQNATQNDLGSRAWVNPFTGVFPSTAMNHTGHTHTGTSHRILVEINDLNTALNPGAKYYAEVQYVTSNEYSWCQSHPGQCNMHNNASHRPYHVNGTTSFAFSPAGAAVMSPALEAWTGATINLIEPESGIDGRAFIAWKVTGPVAGVWHYEYALYNQNLDRGVQSFSVPLGGLITVSNLGFHAPPNHPGFPNDGTLGDAGYGNTSWTSSQTPSALSWSTETFAQNQNANAIRWGTLYNFRFDSNRPPQTTNATIGFFKTGTPVTVGIQGPDASNATPTPIPTPTPGATATPTPTATLTPTPIPMPTTTPGGTARAINLSTRMLVGTGDNVGIGGFILFSTLGSASRGVLVRAIGPSLEQFGIPNVLADPVLELHGQAGFETITNDNWDYTVEGTGLEPTNQLESAIYRTLVPGNYTVVVRGKNNTSGVALVEVYDITSFVNATRLLNLSTRAFVNTGDDIIIAGFILGSYSGPTRIVLRGLGPSLAAIPLEVPNPLANPTLELRDSNGALLAANDNWVDDPAQAAALRDVHLAPVHPLEAGIVTTLPAGVYTALLSGVNQSTGVGLVEVYDLGAP